MAAPVGHIICALAVLNSGHAIEDKNAFLAGTSFPDIRYVSQLSRAHTHKLESSKLSDVLNASSFEAGRRFHAWVDLEREKFMKKEGAYDIVKDVPYPTHMLKIIEDEVLLEKKKLEINPQQIFGQIYAEELAFLPDEARLKAWHRILITYLDDSSWFHFIRYFKAYREYQKLTHKSEGFFKDLKFKIKAFGFFIYAYAQVYKLSQDPKLRNIILGFYEDKITELIGSKFVPN